MTTFSVASSHSESVHVVVAFHVAVAFPVVVAFHVAVAFPVVVAFHVAVAFKPEHSLWDIMPALLTPP
jgi:Na+(H+)/acetate symporter ActP